MTSLSLWWPLADHEDVRVALEAAYADGSRGYHDTVHLCEVFDRLVELAPTTAFDREPVLLAAWFHDAVYDGQPGAEERSAQWAATALADHPGVEEVVRLVLLTEHHRPADDDVNGGALSDADLAILAAPPERYAAYVASVRAEYAHVSDADFASGRSAILADLLTKPALFHTAHAREHWEAPARANVERELSELRR
ncbi:HD domain-containing protein [Nocardioides sp.]|uniref:HD domain-containing protein n=1 Tax=Nocardioides sp. TaxID=35761 RepID=UPI003D12A971